MTIDGGVRMWPILPGGVFPLSSATTCRLRGSSRIFYRDPSWVLVEFSFSVGVPGRPSYL